MRNNFSAGYERTQGGRSGNVPLLHQEDAFINQPKPRGFEVFSLPEG